MVRGPVGFAVSETICRASGIRASLSKSVQLGFPFWVPDPVEYTLPLH